jgi:nucleotide-binding universal stress UspA family protein
MFEKIFVALELNSAAHEIVSCLGGLKSIGAREAYLIQYLTVNEIIAKAVEVSVDQLRSELDELKTDLEQQGFKVEAETAIASSAAGINRSIQAKNVTLIVIGEPVSSLEKEVLYGGVATTILHHQEKPILVYRLLGNASLCIGQACDFFSHILFPTDFSANADVAFTVLEQIVKVDGVNKVTLLHVQDQVRIDPHLKDRLDEFMEIDQDRLNDLKRYLTNKADLEVETMIRYGKTASVLLNAEQEIQPSLVIMGSQGRGFIDEIFLGSVSHTMARKGSSHLLLVPMTR